MGENDSRIRGDISMWIVIKSTIQAEEEKSLTNNEALQKLANEIVPGYYG